MTEITEEGLFLIEDGEVTNIHSTAGEPNLDALREYVEDWGLEL